MSKLASLATVTTGYLSQQQINSNFDKITTAFNNTVSIDGSTPNSLQSNLDLNGFRVINLPDPTDNSDAATKGWITANYGALSATTAVDSLRVTATGGTEELTLSYRAAWIINVRDFGALGDNSTNDYTAIQAALTRLKTLGGGILRFEFGKTYKIGTGLGLTSANNIIFDLQNSTVTTSTNNLNLFTFTTCTHIQFINSFLQGNGTASAASNGIGLVFNNCDYVTIKDSYCTNFGSSGLRIDNTSPHAVYNISKTVFYKNVNYLSSSAISDIYCIGDVAQVIANDNTHIAHSSNPLSCGFFIANSTSAHNWQDVKVSKSYFIGYARGGVYGTDENNDATFDSGEMLIEGCTIVDCIEEGIKLKNVLRSRVIGNLIVNCDQVAEISGNLQGAIITNGGQFTIISNNIILTAQNNGIRVAGQTSAGDITTGAGRSSFIVNNNLIDNVQGGSQKVAGIFITFKTYDVIVTSNIVTNSKVSLWVDGTGISGENPTGINIANNNFRFGESSGSSSSSSIVLNYVDNVSLSNNIVREARAYGLVMTNCTNVTVIGGQFLDNGTGSSANFSGIRLSSCTNVIFGNFRSTNFIGTTQKYGVSFGSSNTNCSINGCDLTGNASGAVETPPTDLLIGTNLGFVGQKVVFADTDVSPSVKNGKYFQTTGTTAITAFDDGMQCQEITVKASGNITITHNANIILNGAINFAMVSGNTLTLIADSATVWIEKGRKV